MVSKRVSHRSRANRSSAPLREQWNSSRASVGRRRTEWEPVRHTLSRHHHQVRICALVLLALLVVLPSLHHSSQAWGQSNSLEVVKEYQVKAAFLLNFIKFIEWPTGTFATPSEEIRISVYGRNPFDSVTCAELTARTINGRAVVVVVAEDTAEIAKCHVLFVPSTQERLVETLPQLAEQHHILTVGEANGFINRTGMIGFVREHNLLRFEINLAAIDHAGIRISSQVLRLASSVIR